VYQSLVDELLRHLGRLTLSHDKNADDQLASFLLSEPDVDNCLDTVELAFRLVENVGTSPDYRNTCHCDLTPDEAIADLNHRFLTTWNRGTNTSRARSSGPTPSISMPKSFKPTLALLQDKRYKGANDEFLKAHEHYRKVKSRIR